MGDLEHTIRVVVEDLIKDEEDLFIVDVKVKGNQGNQKVLVFLDGDKGLNIDRCSAVSRKLGHIMEEQDMISGKYTLEVSSPGLDHPIKLKRQYSKNLGRSLEVESLDGQKREGKLLRVDVEHLVLEIEGKSEVINFNEVLQSKILVSFK